MIILKSSVGKQVSNLFSWLHVQDINLRCEPGSLTMVVGAVGSGKSSLLATLFQQITLVEGSVKV